MSEIAQLPADHPWATVGIIAAVLALGWLVRPRPRRPRPGDAVRDPHGIPGLPKASWLNLHPRTLDRSAFRRHAGDPGEAFLSWYRTAASDRV